MMCQRLAAEAVSALAMNVDIPEKALSKNPRTDVWGFPTRTCEFSRAGPGSGKPKSYEPFWGVSRAGGRMADGQFASRRYDNPEQEIDQRRTGRDAKL
jgi:hypothetical protein